MFRRKEDSLFDTDTITTESATVVTPPAAAASAPVSAPVAAAQPSRPVSEPRPVSTSAPAFRPTASIGDITRSRLPETKAPLPSTNATAAASEKNKSSGKRVLTVGNDILLKGEIATCDRLVIEGKVDATLNDVHTVEIAEHGSFKGSAHIEDAEISGLFEGDLIVRNRLVIYSTGKVRGKITYGEIEIERGGELTGEIKSGNAQSGAGLSRPARAPKEEKVAA